MRGGEQMRVIGRGHPNFGEVGEFVRILSAEEAEVGRDPTMNHLVRMRLFEPQLLTGTDTSIVVVRGLSDAAIEEALAHGEKFEIDDGVRGFLFRADELKPLRDAQEPFWSRFLERREVFQRNGNARRRAHRACNCWRNHREEVAAEVARGCHPIDLFLSATNPVFRRSTRLSTSGYVDLCRASGKDMRDVADVLRHMLFENRQVEEVNELVPSCSCGLN